MSATTTEQPSKATIARRRNAQGRRAKVCQAGGSRHDLILGADATRALERIKKRDGVNATTAITRLLLGAS